MAKRIREEQDIYLAPKIVEKYRRNRYFAEDERNASCEIDVSHRSASVFAVSVARAAKNDETKSYVEIPS